MSLVLPRSRATFMPGWVRNDLWRRARAVPSLDLRFADRKSLVDAVSGQNLITFTRSSNGTYVDSQGVLQTAATNEPRFDHNPTTGESLGLLVEEQRTNLLLWSEEFGTTWTTTRASISSDAAIAPNGATTADRIVEDTTATSTHVVQQTGINYVSGLSYTFSCYVKEAGRQSVRLSFPSAAFTTNVFGHFNLANGSVTSSSAGVVSTIQAVANGWYRCTVTATAVTSVSAEATIFIGETSDTTNTSFTGNGVSGLFVWGAQLEAGAFPTSYIPTTGSAATRNADVVSITGTNFSSWYRQSEGTIYVTSINYGNNSDTTLFCIDDDTTGQANQIDTRLSAGVSYRCRVRSNSTNVSEINPGPSFALGEKMRLAQAYKQDDFAASQNGLAAVVDTSGALPDIPGSILKLKRRGTNEAGSVCYQRFTFWPQRLPNATLQAITL